MTDGWPALPIHLILLYELFRALPCLQKPDKNSFAKRNRVNRKPCGFNSVQEIADYTKAVVFISNSPSAVIKIEFQGGESLLNFDIVKHIVTEVESCHVNENKDIEFVVTTNLYAINHDIVGFCLEHGIYISTSLDGPRELHNHNRGKPGFDSYSKVINGIRYTQEYLGKDQVSALMTATKSSLPYAKEIVDEYISQGFCSIFLRSLNPYGLAADSGLYGIEEWLEFYKEALQYIIQVNRQGTYFCEEFAAIMLGKILTPFPTGFVDLQSPAGLGISGMVINYDGDVYPSDESRMLAEMGDDYFKLGNVFNDSYSDIIQSDKLKRMLETTMTECTPMCADCGISAILRQ